MAETTHHVGIIMNGVTGRMGTNQHLVRSILAIRDSGGVRLEGGGTIMPEPVLLGRNPAKLKARKEREKVMDVLMRAELMLPAAHKQDPEGRDPTRVSGFKDIEDPDIVAVMKRLQLRLRKPEEDTGT